MSVQTAYNQNMTEAFAGMLADMRDNVVESFAAEGAGGIGFGLAVIAGTDKTKQVKLPAAAGGVFRGVTLAEQAQEHTSVGGSTVKYAQYDAVNVLRRGAIVVVVCAEVHADAAAYFMNSGPTAGQFLQSDNAGTDPVPEGVFRTSTTGAGLAVLEVNMPASGTVTS